VAPVFSVDGLLVESAHHASDPSRAASVPPFDGRSDAGVACSAAIGIDISGDL
jgi:hypothetical protein